MRTAAIVVVINAAINNTMIDHHHSVYSLLLNYYHYYSIVTLVSFSSHVFVSFLFHSFFPPLSCKALWINCDVSEVSYEWSWVEQIQSKKCMYIWYISRKKISPLWVLGWCHLFLLSIPHHHLKPNGGMESRLLLSSYFIKLLACLWNLIGKGLLCYYVKNVSPLEQEHWRVRETPSTDCPAECGRTLHTWDFFRQRTK